MKCLFSLVLIVSATIFVDAFVVPERRTILLRPFDRTPQSPLERRKTVAPPSTRTTTITRLQFSLSSPAIKWAAGHVLGGLLPVPFVTGATTTWYRRIDLPSWTPPDRLFGPVWTFLYSSMGVAAYRVATTSAGASWLMNLWWLHLALNYSWAAVFFGMQRLRLGLIINFLLVATLALIIPLFYQTNTLSGLLLLPYAAWVSFATALNWAVCKRNPTSGKYNEAMIQAKILAMQKDIK